MRQAPMQKQQSFSLMFAAALGIALALGLTSFGVTRLFIDPPAGDLARSDGSQPGAPQSQDAPPVMDSALQAQAHQQLVFLMALRDSVAADSMNGMKVLTYANALYDARIYRRASEVYERYLREIDSTNADARIDYGFTLFEQDSVEKALEQTKYALNFKPEHPVAMFNIAIIMLQQEQTEDAKSWLKRCLAAIGDDQMEMRQRVEHVLMTLEQETNQVNP